MSFLKKSSRFPLYCKEAPESVLGVIDSFLVYLVPRVLKECERLHHPWSSAPTPFPEPFIYFSLSLPMSCPLLPSCLYLLGKMKIPIQERPKETRWSSSYLCRALEHKYTPGLQVSPGCLGQPDGDLCFFCRYKPSSWRGEVPYLRPCSKKEAKTELTAALTLECMLPYSTGEWDGPKWFQGLCSSLPLRGRRVGFPDTPPSEGKKHFGK